MFLGFFCIKKPSTFVGGFLSTQHILGEGFIIQLSHLNYIIPLIAL